MKGLLTKEILVIWKNSSYMLMFLMVMLFSLMGIISNGTFFLVYAAILLGSIPVGYMAYDETSRWQQFSLALPYKRSQIVSAKYIITMIMAGISTLIMAAGIISGMLRDGEFNIQVFVLALSSAPAVGLILPALFIPLNFKFGVTKATAIRLILIGIVVACATSVMIILTSGREDGDSTVIDFITTAVNKLTAVSPIILAFMVLGITAVIFALSWKISINIFRKKDM